MDVVIRRAREEDIAAVAALERVCESRPWSEAQFREELTLAHARLFVALCGGEPCGFVDLHIAADDAHINELGVAPKARRRGIARALMERAEAQARGERCTVLSLEVRESNAAAAALYEACGFRGVGKRKKFYAEPVEDGVIMLKEL